MKESEVMWLLANVQPATIDELMEFSDDARGSIQPTLKRLEGHGFVHKRQRDVGGKGRNPYEWSIRVMGDE